MEIKNISIEKLIPYEFNNKEHDEIQITRIASSIKEFWFVQPIVIDKDNTIIIWHGRYLAAIELWLKEVPIVRADTLDKDQVRKLRILDNKLNESEWHLWNLKLELDYLWQLDIWELNIDIKDMFPDLDMGDENDVDDENENTIPEDPTKIIVEEWDIFWLWAYIEKDWKKLDVVEFIK